MVDRASYLLLRIALQCGEIEARIRNYGTDVSIHPAEIHMIKTLKECGESHISGLAARLGVTKGAVSQLVAKLHKKGLVEKDKDDAKLSKLKVRLTAKGETAHARHQHLHTRFDTITEEELAGYPDEYREFLCAFLKKISGRLEKEEG